MKIHLINDNCVEELSKRKDETLDCFICDPPYGLVFMDRKFDDLGIGREKIEWHKKWLSQAHRVLKTNGVIKAFSSSRTQYHLIIAMYECGFSDISVDIWSYRNGFPKALDISKEFDRIEGNEREIVGWKKSSPKGVKNAEMRDRKGAGSFGGESKEIPVTIPFGDNAKTWEGWFTSLRPSYEPIIIGHKR